MKQAQEAERQTSLPMATRATISKTPQGAQHEEQHFNDWPNAAGFNALDDTRTTRELGMTGSIPDYAAGFLYRTGPGGYKVSRQDPKDAAEKWKAVSHWFDGFTVTHKFELVPGEDGHCKQVLYSSRTQSDELIEHARKTGKLSGITFGQKRDPCDTLYRKLKTVFEPVLPGTAQSQEIGVAFQVVLPREIERAAEESGDISSRRLITISSDKHVTKQIDADTLEPLGVTQQEHLHPSLKGPLSAAHASQDPETGDIYNYNLAFGRQATYRVFRASPTTGEVEILATISSSDIPGAYIHSLFLTQNFVVLCVWTAHFKASGLSILWERNILDAIAPFDPKSTAMWLVVDRRKGRGLVKKFTSPAFFSFHSVNAWEVPSASKEGEVNLFCELAQFDNLDILHRFYYENMVSNSPGAPQHASRGSRDGGIARYKLPSVPLSGHCKVQKPAAAERILHIPSPKAGDLPRINPRCALKQHRYVWSTIDRGNSSFVDGLVKTDTLTEEAVVWECEKHTPGEPIFIPKPGAEDEDDGVVLVVVFNGETGSSYLLCLDARTMTEVGRAEVGKPVGFGFHGVHVKNA